MSTRLWLAVLCGYFALGATIQALPALLARRPGHDRPAGHARGRGDRGHAPVRGPARGSRPRARRGACGRGARRRGRGRPPRRRRDRALALARLTIGAGEGALFTGALARVLEPRPVERRGRLIGHFGLSMWGGLAAGPPLAALVAAQTAPRGALWLAATAGAGRARADRRARALGGRRSPRRARVTPRPTRARRAPPRSPHPLARRSDPRVSSRGRRGGPASCSGWRRSGTGRSTRSPCCRPAPAALGVFAAAFLAVRLLGSRLVDDLGPRRVVVASAALEGVRARGRRGRDRAARRRSPSPARRSRSCFPRSPCGSSRPRPSASAAPRSGR